MAIKDLYSSEEFEAKYSYFGPDLGATWTKKKTTFRLWAPTARQVKVNLYRSGDPDVNDRLLQINMTPSVAGTWLAEAPGDLNGIYYTYLVELEDRVSEACDPYARTTGVNGHRAMILDLRSTNPKGWERDRNPHAGEKITDAIIYELHVRDLSIHESSGIRNKGKFLGLIETGTTTPDGIPTGLDHIKSLGITHLHLLPVFNYGSVDERHLDRPQFNWGYDPMNFNDPEGSYATDPYDGAVRVREMKQMVKGLHDNGISVVMDVVYNHVYDAGTFCFNQIVPAYFSRVHQDTYSNGSGCGNDTASERTMVRKYIVDSVNYWADEYHIDGFRFDLVGLLDVDTINEIVATVHQDHPDVIFYGEGWDLNTQLTKPDVQLAVQRNAHLTPNFAYFSDSFRDLLRGSVFDDHATGYISGAPGLTEELNQCFRGASPWCPGPAQTVNYASCHDNMALFDRLAMSVPEAPREVWIRMNRLAAAIYMTAQGIPFFQAGEEMLRSKPLPDGTFDHNSYSSPDSVNSLKWNLLAKPEYRDMVDYYRGLIAFRKAHPSLRQCTPESVSCMVHTICHPNPNVAVFQIRCCPADSAQGIFVIFNPNPDTVEVALPNGEWQVCINGRYAGTDPLATVRDQVTVPGISAVVLTLDPPASQDKRTGRVARVRSAITNKVSRITKKTRK